jgi:hypothetical protein
VLYSPETFDNERVEQLFHKDTNFRELRAISEEAGWNGKDIFKRMPYIDLIMGTHNINEFPSLIKKIENDENYQPDENDNFQDELSIEIDEDKISPEEEFIKIAKLLNELRNKMNGVATRKEVNELKKVSKILEGIKI